MIMDATCRSNATNEERKEAAKEAVARFDYVRFTYTDFHGMARSRIVPAASLDTAFQNGCSVYAGELPWLGRKVVPVFAMICFDQTD